MRLRCTAVTSRQALSGVNSAGVRDAASASSATTVACRPEPRSASHNSVPQPAAASTAPASRLVIVHTKLLQLCMTPLSQWYAFPSSTTTRAANTRSPWCATDSRAATVAGDSRGPTTPAAVRRGSANRPAIGSAVWFAASTTTSPAAADTRGSASLDPHAVSAATTMGRHSITGWSRLRLLQCCVAAAAIADRASTAVSTECV